jgi:hypothetical protein
MLSLLKLNLKSPPGCTNVICSINSKCSVYGELNVVTDDVKLENCEYDAECIS